MKRFTILAFTALLMVGCHAVSGQHHEHQDSITTARPTLRRFYELAMA